MEEMQRSGVVPLESSAMREMRSKLRALLKPPIQHGNVLPRYLMRPSKLEYRYALSDNEMKKMPEYVNLKLCRCIQKLSKVCFPGRGGQAILVQIRLEMCQFARN